MATKPIETIKNVNGASIGVLLNSILKNDKSGYFAGAPAIDNTAASLNQFGQYIFAQQNRRNQFIDSLMNKIAFTIMRTLTFYNKWNRYTEKGVLDFGETVEEIYIGLCKSEQYEWTEDINATLKNLYGKHQPTVASAFHSINWRKYYPITVSYDNLKMAFRSYDALEQFIQETINSMYKSYEYDNWLVTKYMIYRGALDGQLYNVTVGALSADTISSTYVAMKTTLYDAEMVRSRYNAAHVPMNMERSRTLIATSFDFAALSDVEILSKAFNLSKVEFAERQLPLDGFEPEEIERLNDMLATDQTYIPFTDEELEKISQIYAVIFDEDYILNYTAVFELNSRENEVERYRNYFLHVWKIYSRSPFKNAIMVSGEASEVTGITVTPAAATMGRGTAMRFAADVAVNGFADQRVAWTMTGNNSEDTYVELDGNVKIGKDETAKKVNVIATSMAQPAVAGTAVVTVS